MTRNTVHPTRTVPEASRPLPAAVKQGLGVGPKLQATIAESPCALDIA